MDNARRLTRREVIAGSVGGFAGLVFGGIADETRKLVEPDRIIIHQAPRLDSLDTDKFPTTAFQLKDPRIRGMQLQTTSTDLFAKNTDGKITPIFSQPTRPDKKTGALIDTNQAQTVISPDGNTIFISAPPSTMIEPYPGARMRLSNNNIGLFYHRDTNGNVHCITRELGKDDSFIMGTDGTIYLVSTSPSEVNSMTVDDKIEITKLNPSDVISDNEPKTIKIFKPHFGQAESYLSRFYPDSSLQTPININAQRKHRHMAIKNMNKRAWFIMDGIRAQAYSADVSGEGILYTDLNDPNKPPTIITAQTIFQQYFTEHNIPPYNDDQMQRIISSGFTSLYIGEVTNHGVIIHFKTERWQVYESINYPFET